MRVVVVGGGFAGLITASELVAHGIEDVSVLEKSPVSGGVARTVRRDGFELEPAAVAGTAIESFLRSRRFPVRGQASSR